MRTRIILLSLSIMTSFGITSCNKTTQNSTTNSDQEVSIVANDSSTLDLSNGVNVSHWLSQNGNFKENRLTMITKKDFDSIAAMGFKHVRLPIDEEQLYDENMNRDAEGFQLLNNAIQWTLENNMNIIVDLHILRSYHFNSENARPNYLFESDTAKAQFLAIWLDLQKELKKYPNDRVAYEILNEPAAPTCQAWNEFVAKYIETIRKEEPNRFLVIGSNYWQTPDAFRELSVPANDKKLILSFHYYHPALITHYLAPWNQETNFYHGKVNYPGQIIEDTTTAYAGLTEEQKAKLRIHNIYVTSTELEEGIQIAINVADSLHLPLYCGEFGVYPSYIDKEIRLRWYNDVVDIFRKHNIANAHWCYKGDFPVVKEDGSANELPALLTK